MLNIFRSKWSDYPLVMPEIDLRARLPMNHLKKMRVLNVGAGSGYSGLARQLPFLPFKELDHCDIENIYLDAARAKQWRAKKVIFINQDIRKMAFQNYDLILMFDVLEHLPKEDSLAVLKKIICPHLIFIPLEEEFRANIYEAKSQDHLSLWTKKEFDDLGYRTEELPFFHNEDGRRFSALWAHKY